MSCIMRYAQSVSLDAGAGPAANFFFRANSIHAPSITVAGHQPYGHDTYETLYNHYEVDRSIITVSLNSAPVNMTFGVSVADDQLVSADYDQIKETKGTKFVAVNSGSAPVTITNHFNKKSFFPRTSSTDTGSVFGANPTEESIFHIWQTGNLPTNNPGAIALQVTITYFVTCWDPKDLGRS